MITARPIPHLVRARVCAGPLPRVVAMAVLLFGIVSLHGLNAESTGTHRVTSAAASVVVPHEEIPGTGNARTAPRLAPGAGNPRTAPRLAAIGEPAEGHASSHTNEHCVSGQPQQGPVLTPPCFAVSVSESAAVGRASGRPGLDVPVPPAGSSTALRLSVVQQV